MTSVDWTQPFVFSRRLQNKYFFSFFASGTYIKLTGVWRQIDWCKFHPNSTNCSRVINVFWPANSTRSDYSCIVMYKLETCYVCLTLINHNVYTQSTNSLWNEEIYTMCTCTSTKCGGVLEVLSFAWAARLKWKVESHVKQVHVL